MVSAACPALCLRVAKAALDYIGHGPTVLGEHTVALVFGGVDEGRQLPDSLGVRFSDDLGLDGWKTFQDVVSYGDGHHVAVHCGRIKSAIMNPDRRKLTPQSPEPMMIVQLTASYPGTLQPCSILHATAEACK